MINSQKCAYCNKGFYSLNSRKKYCSNTCRTYNSQLKNGKLNAVQIRKRALKNDAFYQRLLLYFTPKATDSMDKKSTFNIDKEYGVIPVEILENGYVVSSTNAKLIELLKRKFNGEEMNYMTLTSSINRGRSVRGYSCFIPRQ